MSEKVHITAHPAYQIGEISPRLFGAFMEPIGTIVNGTMFNPKHPTAEAHGFRMDVINGLKSAKMPAIRTPGGNFVSGWHWKDSIGPKSQRKVHLDPAWGQYITNEIGHDEYLQWAEMTGAEPMYTINLGTGTMQDAMDIVEYTNHSKGSYWSDLRRKYGHENPYGVKIWYLGNEMDGPWQIGSWEKNPSGYGVLAHETSKAMKMISPGIETAVCASSSPFEPHYPEWDEKVLSECYDTIDYVSMHHYHAAEEGDIQSLLGGCDAFFEDYIRTELGLLDYMQTKMRSPKKVMISFDEYGAFCHPLRKVHPGYGVWAKANAYYQPNFTEYTLHDPDDMPQNRFRGSQILQALSLASIQMVFLRHADRVKIGCMTGGIDALCSADHDHVWRSAPYYVMEQLIEHAKGTSLELSIDCETFDIHGYAIDDTQAYADRYGVRYVDGAASKCGNELTIFLINKNETETYPLELDLRGFGELTLNEKSDLFTENLNAGNTYETPDRIKPIITLASEFETNGITFRGGILTDQLRPLSFVVYRLHEAT